jgi:hypothetical protein
MLCVCSVCVTRCVACVWHPVWPAAALGGWKAETYLFARTVYGRKLHGKGLP